MFQLFRPFALVVAGSLSTENISESESVVFPVFAGSGGGTVWADVPRAAVRGDKATYRSRRLMAFMVDILLQPCAVPIPSASKKVRRWLATKRSALIQVKGRPFMEKPIRVGIVGARFAARFHWEGLSRVHGVPVQVVGVTSKTVEGRDAFAKEKKIQPFQNLADLCEVVDVIDLCTPPASHESLAIQALALGKHVIIEKPFTGYFGVDVNDFRGNVFPKKNMLEETLKSCERILAAAAGAGKKVCYAEN